MSENIPYRVKNCVTHHNACDCREYSFALLQSENIKLVERVKELEEWKAEVLRHIPKIGEKIKLDGI